MKDIENVIKVMQMFEELCCPSCINFETCGSNNFECVTSFARIATNMTQESEKTKIKRL